MAKYMLLYLSPVSAEQQMNVSPEEMQKGMEPWMAWFGKLGSAILDGGQPLGQGANVAGDEALSLVKAVDFAKAVAVKKS